jgi:hypothetical protein
VEGVEAVSKARVKKKHKDGFPVIQRWDRLWEKRNITDATYGIGTFRGPQAAVKYSKCKVCKGNPHHAPDFVWQGYDAINRRMFE